MTTCADKPHVVYYAFDADDWPLYVGCTCDLTARLGQHKGSAWYKRHLAYIATSEPMDYETALITETHAIRDLGPAFNVLDNLARRIVRDEENQAWWFERYGINMRSRTLRAYLEELTADQARYRYSIPVIAAIQAELDERDRTWAEREAACQPELQPA